jgi:acyl carrier protein
MEPAALAKSDRSLLVVTDTFGKVRDLLQERYGIDKVKVEMETELSSLGLDSLSLVECAFDLEESLQIALADLPQDLGTIGDLVQHITRVQRQAAYCEGRVSEKRA